jgi:hypothetical protein
MQAEWAAVYCVRSRTGSANGASNNATGFLAATLKRTLEQWLLLQQCST